MTKGEKVNLIATLATPLLIGWGIWSVNAKLDLAIANEDRINAETYVSKQWYEKSHDETKAQLQDIQSEMGNIKTDVAVMKDHMLIMKGP
jgi:hypothetical protein